MVGYPLVSAETTCRSGPINRLGRFVRNRGRMKWLSICSMPETADPVISVNEFRRRLVMS